MFVFPQQCFLSLKRPTIKMYKQKPLSRAYPSVLSSKYQTVKPLHGEDLCKVYKRSQWFGHFKVSVLYSRPQFTATSPFPRVILWVLGFTAQTVLSDWWAVTQNWETTLQHMSWSLFPFFAKQNVLPIILLSGWSIVPFLYQTSRTNYQVDWNIYNNAQVLTYYIFSL